MTRFRHDLILRMIKLLDAVLVTIPFAMCWYLYYAKRVASPYYAKGDYLVVALFFVLFIIFGRVYDAFLMSMQRISEIIYEQFLAAAISDFIMYIVIWLLSKHLPNILPGVAALVGQVIMASIWAYNAHHAYFKTFPPQATAVIYDEEDFSRNTISFPVPNPDFVLYEWLRDLEECKGWKSKRIEAEQVYQKKSSLHIYLERAFRILGIEY